MKNRVKVVILTVLISNIRLLFFTAYMGYHLQTNNNYKEFQLSMLTHLMFPFSHCVHLPPFTPPAREIIFPTAVPDPQYILPNQTLTISSLGYLLWRNKRHCYPFYYSKKKVSKRIWTHTLRTSSVMQCYTSLYPLRHSSWRQQRWSN